MAASAGLAPAQDSGPPSVWMRLDPLPGELVLNPRESFEGVPPRFVLLTDGSVFVGGRRDVLRGQLTRDEMQTVATNLDGILKAVGPEGVPPQLSLGEGPEIFRFSVLLGSPFRTVISGSLPVETAPPVSPLADLIRGLAAFRHPSLRPFDPPAFAMRVKEQTLPGGCRPVGSLPPLQNAIASEVVVSEKAVRGFPTGAEMSQICDGARRFRVVFRPIIPGER